MLDQMTRKLFGRRSVIIDRIGQKIARREFDHELDLLTRVHTILTLAIDQRVSR